MARKRAKPIENAGSGSQNSSKPLENGGSSTKKVAGARRVWGTMKSCT